ncbi:metallophosphoesterase family protein [Corynebacterium liangguodongii]|uniref:Phosphoesterase n=1 Tax=Corynebacterium liangguodongii TaxID=2079535 RepID=A0A2S0WDP3_9CORY|nr:metallophosphoesterase family protein [Corynebacterium liangguodongii]AWB83886.1 phosphoesterase [Corynebacterium liangguodongii]PWB99025.1 phosphoesterase [Corynebacterium liangguodongii]
MPNNPAAATNDHTQPRRHSISRRSLLLGGTALAAGAAASRLGAPEASAQTGLGVEDAHAEIPLRFGPDGRFTIVQFNDTQDDHLTDYRTIEFMGRVLDAERPGLALINGDVITSGPQNPEQVYQAINNVVMPMESRDIPWAITFGNHDEDSVEDAGTGVFERQMADFVRTYRHNLNPPAGDRAFGHSDTQLLISGSAEPGTAQFAVWLLDSGNYMPGEFKDKAKEDLPHYDYIRPAQVEWYLKASRAAEERFGRKIPGLMYFHIPTYEHRDMWFGGPGKDGLIDHNAAADKHGIDGVKHEDVYFGSFNSGIYAAVRDRGDVLGIYCGHDHINSYHGDYYGVELGYCPGTGFAPYGLHDGTRDQHTLRGARIFELNENSERVYESTRLVFAKDLGADMVPAKQPIDAPLPLPDYVRMPEATPMPRPQDPATEDSPASSTRSSLSSR